MTDTRPKGKTTICLCWFHPLALEEFRHTLSGNGTRLVERRLERSGAVPKLPRATAYVLEGHSEIGVTEAFLVGLLARYPRARILVVSERIDQATAFSLLRLGAKGLVSFREAPRQLRQAVREVARSGFWVSRSILSRFIELSLHPLRRPGTLAAHPRLSRRENEVCELLLKNLTNREIASRLQVSERTAKFHVSNLLGKYGLKRRADLVVLSYTLLDQGHSRAGPASTRG